MMRTACVMGCFVYLLARASAAVHPGMGCAPTAEAAVARILDGAKGDGAVTGYRVVSVHTDVLRKRKWAMVASCLNPAKPLVAVEMAESVVGSMPMLPAEVQVRIGDRVVVIHEGGDSRMQVTGWAEGSGSREDVVRVRMPRLSEEADEALPVIRCRVVGTDVVEVIR